MTGNTHKVVYRENDNAEQILIGYGTEEVCRKYVLVHKKKGWKGIWEVVPMPFNKRWYELKEQYPDEILLFRKGDCYEAYETDAAKVGKILNIPTEKHEDGLYSVCRFPRISLNENYLPQLVSTGNRVAIIDEL